VLIIISCQRLRRNMVGALLATIAAVFVTATTARAQETSDEPLLDELTRTFKKKSFSVGALFQTVGIFQWERTLPGGNGFSIANLRLIISGELDSGFGYLFAANFVRSPAILDAKMYYAFAPALTVDAGLFKTPFSRELLTFAGSIDFVDRSRVVFALAPARQLGVAARGRLAGGQLLYGVGVFNGPRLFEGNFNDNDRFLYVGRLSYYPAQLQGPGKSDQFEVAVNAGYSDDEDVVLVGFPDGFAGQRYLIGADARLTRGKWLAAGEVIASRLEPNDGSSIEPFGWHLSGGYMITRKSQVLIRWDKFKPDTGTSSPDQIVLGYNVWPTTPTEIQVDYVIPTSGGVGEQLLLLNAQVAF
jgi:hypothetical protein